MSFLLGNLSVKDMERRLGVSFPPSLTKFLEENHQPAANAVAAGKWHCYDAPFVLVCGDEDTAVKINGQLSPLAKRFAAKLTIALEPKGNDE